MRDRHVLASSWSLPFAFLLAFTGSFFSFAGTVGFPLVATVAFGGDEEAMSATLFEPPVPEDPTPAPLASLDYILANSTARAGGPVTYVGISDYGRADARVFVWHDPSAGGMLYVTNVYEGPSRAFLGRQAPVGTRPSAGGLFYGLMYPLHFGHFAGILSKAIWGALGVAMCFVILSGFRLWVRRRADQATWRGFGRAVQITGYGLPIAMLASAYAFFPSRPAGDPFWWTPAGFVLGAAIAIAVGLRVPDPARLGTLYQRLLGAACLLLPVLRLATGGMDWAEALLAGSDRRADRRPAPAHRRRRPAVARPRPPAEAPAAARPGTCRVSVLATLAAIAVSLAGFAHLARDRPEAPPRLPAARPGAAPAGRRLGGGAAAGLPRAGLGRSRRLLRLARRQLGARLDARRGIAAPSRLDPPGDPRPAAPAPRSRRAAAARRAGAGGPPCSGPGARRSPSACASSSWRLPPSKPGWRSRSEPRTWSWSSRARARRPGRRARARAEAPGPAIRRACLSPTRGCRTGPQAIRFVLGEDSR